MDIATSLFLGALEGFTEFLPISSTGHLILASDLLGLAATETLKSFQIAVQLGAILAVVALYWRTLLNLPLLLRLGVAFLPTGILGFLLYGVIKEYLIGNGSVVAWALIAGGIALVAFEQYHKEPKDDGSYSPISYRTAFSVGLAQAVSMVPGVSRSAATIMGGLSLGLSRRTIIEFSFLLAVPTMMAATGYDLYKSAHLFSTEEAWTLLIGFLTSFVVAMWSMRFLIGVVKKYGFAPFGWYRILLGIFFLFFILP